MAESKVTHSTMMSIGLVLVLIGGVVYIVTELSKASARAQVNCTRIETNAKAIDEIKDRLELLDEIRASQRRIETALERRPQ